MFKVRYLSIGTGVDIYGEIRSCGNVPARELFVIPSLASHIHVTLVFNPHNKEWFPVQRIYDLKL